MNSYVLRSSGYRNGDQEVDGGSRIYESSSPATAEDRNFWERQAQLRMEADGLVAPFQYWWHETKVVSDR